jgi:AcrR family transcriptional regulator
MNGESGQERILRAALECFARQGVSATTLTNLRNAAGVSVGTFYHHFQNKEQVVSALFVNALREYQADFLAELRRHPDPRQALPAIVAFHVDWCARRPDQALFMLTERPPRAGEPGAAALADQNRTFFSEVTGWWNVQVHHGALRPADPVIISVLWIGPAQELCRHWLSGRIPKPTDDQIALLGEAAWLSLKA